MGFFWVCNRDLRESNYHEKELFIKKKKKPVSAKCGLDAPDNQQMSKCSSLKARIRRLCYLCVSETIQDQRLRFKGSRVCLTSEDVVDVDGAEYSFRRPAGSEVSDNERVFAG
jgi:hypothetical protein